MIKKVWHLKKMALNLLTFVVMLLVLRVGTLDEVLANDRFGFDDAPIQTEYVDRSNLDRILAMFNLTEAQMKRISPGLTTTNKATDTTDNSSTQYFNNAKEYRWVPFQLSRLFHSYQKLLIKSIRRKDYLNY